MTGKTILLIIFIVILLVIVYSYILKDVNTLTNIVNGETMTKIDSTTLATNSSSSSNPSNFTYSVWFYINDWNYRYGEPKTIFGRMGALSTNGSGSVTGINGLDPCPAVVLAPVENNLLVSLGCFPGANQQPTTTGGKTVVHTCAVANVPIQKWVNLLISVYGRTMDIYIDGKLVKTCLLPGVASVNSTAPVYVTPAGGFSGWTSKLQYWPNSTDPQEAWNIYAKGYGASWLSNLFGQYKIQIALMKNGTETSSVEI
jgi:hypothetical protein